MLDNQWREHPSGREWENTFRQSPSRRGTPIRPGPGAGMVELEQIHRNMQDPLAAGRPAIVQQPTFGPSSFPFAEDWAESHLREGTGVTEAEPMWSKAGSYQGRLLKEDVAPMKTPSMAGPDLSLSDKAKIREAMYGKEAAPPLEEAMFGKGAVPSLDFADSASRGGYAAQSSSPYLGQDFSQHPYKPIDPYPGSMAAPEVDPLSPEARYGGRDLVSSVPDAHFNLSPQAWQDTLDAVRSPQSRAMRAIAPYAKAAGRVLSHPITGAGASALGPVLSHLPIVQQYAAEPDHRGGIMRGAPKRRAGLDRAMELRPEMFAEPHMGPPRPKLSYDEAGWVVKKEPGDWNNLPQDPFQRYSDMPNREWEKEMGFGVNEVRRGETYVPSPFEFWNPPLYFPKSKEDLAANWPHGRGPLPEHLKP